MGRPFSAKAMRYIRIPTRAQVLAIVGVCIAYYLAAIAGMGLALPHTSAAPVWAPSGIALAALVLGGRRLWPAITLGAFSASLYTFWRTEPVDIGVLVLVSAAIAVGNTLEALLVHWLCRRFIGPAMSFEHARDPMVLGLIAAVSCMLASSIGVMAVCTAGVAPWGLASVAWLTWSLGNLAGMVVVTPVIVTASVGHSWLSIRARILRIAGSLALVATAAALLFASELDPRLAAALVYLILPITLISAVLYGPALTHLCVAMVAAIAVYGALHDQGPFVRPFLHQSFLLVQIFLCLLAVTAGTLATAIVERRTREQTLRQTHRALRVLTRCNAAVVHAVSEGSLLEEVCQVAVSAAGYRLTWVGYAEQDDSKTIRPVAYAGPGEGFLDRIRVSWAEDEYGRGTLGPAIRTGQPAVAHNLLRHPDYSVWNDALRERGFNSVAAVPIAAHGTTYGAMAFYSDEPYAFEPSELSLLAELGTNLAHGILALRMQRQQEQAQAELARRNQELSAIAGIFRTTTAEIKLKALLASALRGALELTGLDGGTLCLLNADNGCLKLSAHINASNDMVSELAAEDVKVGDCLCGQTARTGEPLILWDNASGSEFATHESVRNEGIRFHAAFPMKSRQRVVGVLCLFTRTAAKPHQRQLDLVQDICGPLALSIDNAMLYEQVQRYAAELEQRVLERTAQLKQEILQRELAEASLRESERKYRELVQNANSIILRMDTQGRMTFVNEFAQRFFGYGEQELLGQSVMGSIVPYADSQGQNLEPLIQEIATCPDRHISNENENVRRDGSRVWIAWTNRPILDAQGGLVGTLCVGNDITALKQAEAQLIHAKEAAESADRLKSAFLATMSHELRTPLNSIIGFTGILLQGFPGPLTTEQHKQLGMVQSSARHLLALINDILDLSKIEAGQLDLHCAGFDLRASLEKVLNAVKPLADRKRLELRRQIADGIGPFHGDQRRLEQILFNLLSNAIKFTERGHVALCCVREAGCLAIRVSDTGIGIPLEQLSAVFRPFQQLDSGLSRKHDGTGLGLSICRYLVELMGGTISVESEPGRGSVFTVRLPVEAR